MIENEKIAHWKLDIKTSKVVFSLLFPIFFQPGPSKESPWVQADCWAQYHPRSTPHATRAR